VAAPSLLCPGGMRRRIRRKRQKLMDWDKNSLTELQSEKEMATRILIK